MDEARRASERAAARGDGAAWWVAQLRSGAISRADLELAAWVGDEDARTALGPSVLAGGAPTFEECVRGLGRFGAPILVRALWAMAEPRLGSLEHAAPTPTRSLRTGVLAWCRGPSGMALVRIDRAIHALHEDARARATPSFEVYRQFEGSAFPAMGAEGPWFLQGARDPRRELRIPLLANLGPRAEVDLRDLLIEQARRGESSTWAARSKVPTRPCPSPDPEPAEDARITSLSPTEVELAAWLGDPTARRLLGSSILARWPGSAGWSQGTLEPEELVASDVLAWLQTLDLWGPPWATLAQRALGRVALDLLAPRSDLHAKAARLLAAADSRQDPASLRAIVGQAGLAQSLIGDPSQLHGVTALVEDSVMLAAGAEWNPIKWRGRRSSAVHNLRSGDLVATVRGALLPVLLRHR